MKIYTLLKRVGLALAVAMLAQAFSLSLHAKTRADGVLPPEPATQSSQSGTAGAEAQPAHDGVTPRLVPATAIVPQGVQVGPGAARPGGGVAQGLGISPSQSGPGSVAGQSGPGSVAAQGIRVGPDPASAGPQGIRVGPGYSSGSPQGIHVGPGHSGIGPQGISIGPAPRPLQIRVWTDQNNYNVGDRMRIYFRATRDCYLYIFNTDSRGVERQIYPNHFDQDNFISGDVTFYIPDRSYEFTVTGPGGREKLYAIAIPERYEVVRPFSRFSREEPYPKFQAQMLLNTLRGQLQVSIGGQTGSARPSDRIGPQGISIGPAPDPRRRYEYAEDFVFYNVRSRGVGYDPIGYSRRVGQVRVTTSPSNAVVYLNGERKGHSPLVISNIPFGSYRIYADKNGFQARGHWVVIDGASMGQLHITLPPEVNYWRPRGLEGGVQGAPPGGAIERQATR